MASDVFETRILGVKSSPLNYELTMEMINYWVRSGDKGKYVILKNVYTVMNAYDNKQYKNIVEKSALAIPDGKPVALVNRLRGSKDCCQIRGADLMCRYLKDSLKYRVKHFFYGGGSGIPEKLKEYFEQRFPGVRIVGTYSPPFRTMSMEEDKNICKLINGSGADVLWVGLGSPKQDVWMYEHKDKLDVSVQLGVGAAFDFLTGEKKMAPQWMQYVYLEWLYRLLLEPKRLFKRYLYHNPRYIYYILLELLKKDQKL